MFVSIAVFRDGSWFFFNGCISSMGNEEVVADANLQESLCGTDIEVPLPNLQLGQVNS